MSRFVLNTSYNLLGLVIPGLVAFVSIPILVHQLGSELFALLSLVINLLVSFTLLDFGIAVGVTKYASEVLERNPSSSPSLFWSSSILVLGFSSLFAVIGYFVAPFVLPYLNIPASVTDSANEVFQVTLLAIPFVASSAVFRGYLEASGRFDLTNSVKTPATSAIFLLPLLGAYLGWDILSITIALVLSRVVLSASYFSLILKVQPELRSYRPFSKKDASLILRFGSWVSVSNIINPIVTHGEKFILSSIISLTALTYYTTSYELVARLTIIPFSAAITLLPHLSSRNITENTLSSRQSLKPVYKTLVLLYFPLTLAFLFFPNEILMLYLGDNFAVHASLPLQILSIAFFFNAFAFISLAVINSAGRPYIKTWIDIGIGISFITLCFILIQSYGILGAAIVKFIAIVGDSILLGYFAMRLIGVKASSFFSSRNTAILIFCFVSFFIAIISPQSLTLRLIMYAGFVAVFVRGYITLWGTEEIKRFIDLFRKLIAPSN
jgi:O-antigen/teichoic acid export membrane protein